MDKIPIFFVLFFLFIFSVLNLYSAECDNWSNICKDIETFRSKNNHIESSESNDCVDCFQKIIPNKTDIVQKLEIASQLESHFNNRLMGCMKKHATLIEKYNNEDLETIKKALVRNKISELSYDYLENLFSNPDSSYNQKIQKIRSDNSSFPYYQEYTLTGPYENLNSSLSGFFNYDFIQEPLPLIEKYNRSGLDFLKELSNPNKILNYLTERASSKEMIITPNKDRNPITPSMAKLILFELLYDKLAKKPKELLKIVKDLKLKFNYAQPFSNNDMEVFSEKGLHQFSIHNGYFLGSDFNHIPMSTDSGESFSSTGIDCTLIIQKCLAESGIKFPENFKLLSSRLAALNNPELESQFPELNDYKNLFEAIPYKCEAQLRIGDIIAFNGHALIFAGYEKTQNGKISFLTYEAIAGEYRTFGLQPRELYLADSCQLPRWTSSGKTISANIIRIKDRRNHE